MYPKGNGFVNKDLNRLEDIFKQESFSEAERGSLTEVEGADELYNDALKRFLKEKVGVKEKRKIVVETMGGAGSGYLPETLEALGAEVINLNSAETPYRDPPNPSPNNLQELKSKVESENAYIGLALDLDADRVAAYFKGEWISGDDLFCVFAQLFIGRVVASVDTDTKIEEFCDKVFYTRVGDPFVISKTIETDAALSGEPNGHYCFPEFVNYNSGILSGLILACCDLEDLLHNVPETVVSEDVVVFDSRDEVEKIMQEFESYCGDNFEVLSEVDGVKFVLDGYTVLVRPSGSSPKIRLKGFGQDAGVEDAVGQIRDVLNEVKT
jgi:phosphomannomutase